jgi:myo-inositol-1(or 4)-monophosphatase
MDQKFKPIIKAAQSGGKILKKYFGQKLKTKAKSTPADLITKVDLEAERHILKILSKYFPDYNILSEENGLINKNSDYTLIIDALDGTNNFVLGIPYFSVSIGLVKNSRHSSHCNSHRYNGASKIIFGVIHNPILNQTYWAQRGKGAYLNNKKINVNEINNIRDATVSFLQGYKTPQIHYQKLIKKLAGKKIKRVLAIWSVALDLCLLASGKIETIVCIDVELHDYIAGKLIAREAGALITDFGGKKEENEMNNTFLVSNGTNIHKQILKLL